MQRGPSVPVLHSCRQATQRIHGDRKLGPCRLSPCPSILAPLVLVPLRDDRGSQLVQVTSSNCLWLLSKSGLAEKLVTFFVNISAISCLLHFPVFCRRRFIPCCKKDLQRGLYAEVRVYLCLSLSPGLKSANCRKTPRVFCSPVCSRTFPFTRPPHRRQHSGLY